MEGPTVTKRLRYSPLWLKVLIALAVATVVCFAGLMALRWWISTPYPLGPWIVYDVTVPGKGTISYRSRDLVYRKIMFGPSDWFREVQVVWDTRRGERYSFYGYPVPHAEEPDIEFRLRDDGQAVWLITYGEPYAQDPYVCCCLDFAKREFARFWTSRFDTEDIENQRMGEIVAFGQPLQPESPRHARNLAGYAWANVDSGQPIARWRYLDRWLFGEGVSEWDIMLHWSPGFTRTALRKKRLDREEYALVVESSSSIYRFGEMREDSGKYLILDSSPGGRPKGCAIFDFQRNEFIDENLTVWKFGKAFQDPITKSATPADSYGKWAEE